MNNLTEILVEQLQNTKIFEMARDRSEYMKIVDNLSNQIIENWCLLRYSSIYGKLQTHNHWMKELRAYIMKLQSIKIDVDKTKATRTVLIDWMECDDKNEVFNLIAYKWQEENFDIESKETEEVVDDFVEYGVYELIEVICKKKMTLKELNDYLNGI